MWQLSGINDDIKSLKYSSGDILCAHYDTPYIKNSNEQTFITAVLYLNDDFIGGNFEFVDPNNQHRIHAINIEKGTCLLFQHNTFHKGSSVQKGTKYIIRFDILYKKFNNISTDHSSCIWL